MAKKDLQLNSDMYGAKARDFWKGGAWFIGLGWFTLAAKVWVALALILVGACLTVVGVVLYVFAHQARMLEAEDAVNALPKQASAP